MGNMIDILQQTYVLASYHNVIKIEFLLNPIPNLSTCKFGVKQPLVFLSHNPPII